MHAEKLREKGLGTNGDVQTNTAIKPGRQFAGRTGPDIAAKGVAAGRPQLPPLKRRKLDSSGLSSSTSHTNGTSMAASDSQSPPSSATPFVHRLTHSRAQDSRGSPREGHSGTSSIDAGRLSSEQSLSNSSGLDTVCGTSRTTFPTRIKSEPEELSVPPALQSPILVTSGVYRVTPIPHPRDPSARRAWTTGKVKEFQRRTQMLKVPVLIGNKKLLTDGLVINWSTPTPVMVDSDGFPHLPPESSCAPLTETSRVQTTHDHLVVDDATTEATALPQLLLSAPPSQLTPSLVPSAVPTSPAVVANTLKATPHLPTPSLSPPGQQHQQAIEDMRIDPPSPSPSPSQPLSLFAMLKQKHASAKRHTASPSHPSSLPASVADSPPIGGSSRDNTTENTRSDEAGVDSSDELYVTWEEHRSISKMGLGRPPQNGRSSPAPMDSRAMSVDLPEPSASRASISERFKTSFAMRDDPDASLSSRHPPTNANTEPTWTDAEIEQLQAEATEWLRNYIRVFDTDRSDLAPAYSQHATFSLRQSSYLSSPPELPPRQPPVSHAGTMGILAALLDLPDSFAFNLRDAVPQISYDVVVLFDIFVYAQQRTPGVMLTCYVDPARCPSLDEERGWRWTCEMQFVLRPNDWSEEDSSTGGLWRLVAVSHQMTLRKIPLGTEWQWI